MAMSNEELREYLSVLEIDVGDDLDSVVLGDARQAFKRLALILHPDKAGASSTAAFQKLRDAYEQIRDHFKEKSDFEEKMDPKEDEDSKFFDDNFEAFNFPFENKGSLWQECITHLLGEPTVKINDHGTE